MHRRIDNDVILYFGFTISIWLCFGLTRLYIFFFNLICTMPFSSYYSHDEPARARARKKPQMCTPLRARARRARVREHFFLKRRRVTNTAVHMAIINHQQADRNRV